MNRQRRVWSEQQDNILRYLKEERGEVKWSVIARKMQNEFYLSGRTGKQCRQRYHNHLNSNLTNTHWTQEEDTILFRLHLEFGNKWSSIAQRMPGRSDNAVKNYFYSKLRKSVRRLNRVISDQFAGEYQQISGQLLKSILETSEERFRSSGRTEEEIIDYSNDLKNRLFEYGRECEEQGQQVDSASNSQRLIEDILFFSKNKKKPNKLLRKRAKSFHDDNHLHPSSYPTFSRTNSSASLTSNLSEQFSLGQSSCQLEEPLPLKPRKRSLTTRSQKDVNSPNLSEETLQKQQTLSNREQYCKFIVRSEPCKIKEEKRQRQKQMVQEGPQEDNQNQYVNHGGGRDFSQKNSNSSGSEHFHIFKTFEDFCHLDGNISLHFPFEDFKDTNQEFILRVLQPKPGNLMEGQEQPIIHMEQES